MSAIDHSRTHLCGLRIAEAWAAACAVLINVESGAFVWRDKLDLIDQAIAALQKAKEIHLSRLASEKEAA